MNCFVITQVVMLLVVANVSSKPGELKAEKFEQSWDLKAKEIGYAALKLRAENIVKEALKNASEETAQIMNRIISEVDLAYVGMAELDCKEEQAKLINLKGDTLRAIGRCPEVRKLEEMSWALGIYLSKLVDEIARAYNDLVVCSGSESGAATTEDRQPVVECSITDSEALKSFENLERKVDLLAVKSADMYSDSFLSFVQNCFDENKFNSSLKLIKSSCQY